MQVDKFGEEKVAITLVGNKNDQPDGKFNNASVLEYCSSKGYDHLEVSAKSGDNV